MRPLRATERFMAISCNHGDLRDRRAVKVALDFAKYFKPTVRVHLGDCFDFRWLRKSASEDEKRATPLNDVTGGKELLAAYRPTHFLAGNHEARIYEAMESSNERHAAMCSLLWNDVEEVLKKARAKAYPYCKRRGVVKIGDYNFLHGYSSGVYGLRKTVMSYGNCIMGHLHRVEQTRVEHYPHGATGYCVGTLAQLDMDYNLRQQGTLAQSHGFVYGCIIRGKLKVWQAEKVGGQWVFASEMMTNG